MERRDSPDIDYDSEIAEAAYLDSRTPEKIADGGVMMASSEGVSAEYDVDDPTEQFWWGDVSGKNDIGVVREIFDSVGVHPVYGRDQEFIPRNAAFSESEIDAIENAVDEVYDGTISQFVDEIKVSNVHPQHSMQLERAFDNQTFTPTIFGDYDGFPQHEGEIIADGGRVEEEDDEATETSTRHARPDMGYEDGAPW